MSRAKEGKKAFVTRGISMEIACSLGHGMAMPTRPLRPSVASCPEAIVPQVNGVTVGAIKVGSGHSQESSSLRRQQFLRRQQLSCVPMASVWQKHFKMSKQQKANSHGQLHEWQPLLYKRHGPAERQGHRLLPVQAACGVSLCRDPAGLEAPGAL